MRIIGEGFDIEFENKQFTVHYNVNTKITKRYTGVFRIVKKLFKKSLTEYQYVLEIEQKQQNCNTPILTIKGPYWSNDSKSSI